MVVVGDKDVGKTTLLRRLTGDESAARSTFGVDFAIKSMKLKDVRNIKAQIWDSSGEKRYRVEPKMYYPRAVGALIVYDIKNHATLESAEQWLKEVREHTSEDVVVMLLGNKLDERHLRRVSSDEAAAFAERRGLLFAEVSAAENRNVEESFCSFIAEIVEAAERRRNAEAKDKAEAATASVKRRRGLSAVLKWCSGNCCFTRRRLNPAAAPSSNRSTSDNQAL